MWSPYLEPSLPELGEGLGGCNLVNEVQINVQDGGSRIRLLLYDVVGPDLLEQSTGCR
jgi:hypothetical protein